LASLLTSSHSVGRLEVAVKAKAGSRKWAGGFAKASADNRCSRAPQVYKFGLRNGFVGELRLLVKEIDRL
jgi:hypothetical protein